MTVKLGRVLLTALAIVLAIIWAFPVYWMVNSAFISNAVLQQFTPHFFPGEDFTASNFAGAISDGSFFGALGMSVSITLIVVFFCLIFAFLGAVAISRFKFRGRKTFVLAITIALSWFYIRSLLKEDEQ